TFASTVELAEAVSHAQILLSVDIWNLHSYFSDEARSKYYSNAMFDGTHPDSVDRITEMLADPFMRDVIAEETERLARDYAQNRDLLNYHHAPPVSLATKLRELVDMTYEYTTDMAEHPEMRQFITEDEINESFIRHGSGVYNGKHRIYDYLTGDHTDKEKIEFLKNEYGTGGHSHALSGATYSGEDHDSRGIRLKKPDCADVEMSWSNVLKRLNDLIQKDLYLSQDEKNARKAHFDAEKVYSPIKAEHPDDIVLYQFGTAFAMYGEDAKKAGDLLNRYVFERDLPGIGRVDMCNVDTKRLNESVEKLRERYDVTVISLVNNEWKTESYSKNPLERSEQEIYDQYYPQIHDFVLEDVSYQNACKNADRDNALLEGESAIRRAAAEIQDTGFMRMYYDVPDFHDRIHREILEETYPILIQNTQEQRIDAMLAFAEEVAKESAVEPYERFSVIETEDGFAVWDDIRDEIYVDENGVSQEFGDRQQANEYLEQVRREVDAKEAAEWRYREQVKQEALSDRTYAEEHLIPEETMFTIGNKPYMVDRVDLDSLTVHYQYIGVIIPQGEEIFHSAPVDVIRRYIEIDDIKMNLPPEQQTIVEAFETGGFVFNPSPNTEIRFDDAAGYPLTYKTWEDAYTAIDSAELRDSPGLREEVQRILHLEPPLEEPPKPEQPEYAT
ncbi:MAG: hypothetical protein IJX14_09355, partial [Clostridia bacterium]|nr:hypothetical protein [Clostridia bacterium]